MTVGGAGASHRLEPGTLASFLDFLWRHRVLNLVVVGAATVAAAIGVLVVPVQYTARAVLLPPHNEGTSLLSTAASLLGTNLPNIDLAGLGSDLAVQQAIVRSERMADAMNDRFGLGERYQARKREVRLRVWQARLGTRLTSQGLLEVSYRDRDPEFAAGVVQAVVDELDRLNREIRTTAAGRARTFLEGRVQATRLRLDAIEDSLADYQATHETVALTGGAESAGRAGADLLVRRVELETRLGVLRSTLGPETPAVRSKEAELRALDAQLSRLPALNSVLARMLRDQEVIQRTYGYLSAQLEDARINEARETSTVQVLDPPRVPSQKSYPRRTVTVALVFLASAVAALAAGALLDAARRVREVRGA